MSESPKPPSTAKSKVKASVKKAVSSAPTEPPENANEADQKLLLDAVEPGPGYILAQLVGPADRRGMGFSADAKAFQTSALMQVMRAAQGDDHSTYRAGELVFASLDEIAPLLNTPLFLVPLTRIQGRIRTSGSEVSAPFGFAGG